VLTWNLFHGRSVPDSRRSLLPDFAALIAGWEWDVALLQEVLPWWPPELGRASGASARMALTSRNVLPPLQRLVTERGRTLDRGALSDHAPVTVVLAPER